MTNKITKEIHFADAHAPEVQGLVLLFPDFRIGNESYVDDETVEIGSLLAPGGRSRAAFSGLRIVSLTE
jgi:hypothetical protein